MTWPDTTSGIDLTKARERLESISALCTSVISATATQTETSNVDVPEEKNSQGAADKAEALGLFARTRKG